MKTLILYILLILVTSSAYAGNIRVAFLYDELMSLSSGSEDKESQHLQGPTASFLNTLEFTYMSGMSRGMIVGLQYQKMKSNFILYSAGQRFTPEFTFNSLGLKLGGWWALDSNKSLIDFSINAGNGTFKFSDDNGVKSSELNNIISLSLEGRYTYRILLVPGVFGLDLMINGGLNKIFVPSFDHNSQKYRSSDFDLIPFIGVGAGISF